MARITRTTGETTHFRTRIAAGVVKTPTRRRTLHEVAGRAVSSAVNAKAQPIAAEPAAQTAPTVPFASLDRTHAPLRDELREAFDRVVFANGFILARRGRRLRAPFAAACGLLHCVGVASGTAALHRLGARRHPRRATPVLCDVEPDTGLIDPASAAACIGERPADVVAVHLYGQPCDMDASRSCAIATGSSCWRTPPRRTARPLATGRPVRATQHPRSRLPVRQIVQNCAPRERGDGGLPTAFT